jgi:hypothetical protein
VSPKKTGEKIPSSLLNIDPLDKNAAKRAKHTVDTRSAAA